MDRSGGDGEEAVRIREKYVELLLSLAEKDFNLLSHVQQLLNNATLIKEIYRNANWRILYLLVRHNFL